MNIESTKISTNHKEVGIKLLSEVQEISYTLRIYQIMLNETDCTYHIVQELEAFNLESREELDDLWIIYFILAFRHVAAFASSS